MFRALYSVLGEDGTWCEILSTKHALITWSCISRQIQVTGQGQLPGNLLKNHEGHVHLLKNQTNCTYDTNEAGQETSSVLICIVAGFRKWTMTDVVMM